MTERDRWLLPEGIEEVLPEQAERLEALRRRLLGLFHCWGYDLVVPPFIEYLESLLTGIGNDLGLQTFKLTDQLTGRLMGVRADMTPQVARIDAHRLKRVEPTRLCYLGTVLRTLPDGPAGSRSPVQVGAELYGHAGIEADVEMLCLMLEALGCIGIEDVHLDLGHVGIFRGLARRAGLEPEQEAELFDLLQRKARPEIESYLAALELPAQVRAMLGRLPLLTGDEGVLATAAEVLRDGGPAVVEALDNLRRIAEAVRVRIPGTPLYYDLAELRGYHYQTGVVFAAFVPGCGQEVARGGRYDDIGHVFGRARPATGFSADLKLLLTLGSAGIGGDGRGRGILAPSAPDPVLLERVAELRRGGERVVQELSGQAGDARAMGCDRVLAQRGGAWVVLPFGS